LKIVLNEFIVNRAVGNPVDRANVIALVEKIRNNPSAKVLLSPELLGTYYAKAKKIEKQLRECPKVIKNFMLLIQDFDKAPIIQLSKIKLPPSLEHDRELIATAAAWKSDKLLITTDDDLIKLLKEESITATYHIETLKPEEALQRI